MQDPDPVATGGGLEHLAKRILHFAVVSGQQIPQRRLVRLQREPPLRVLVALRVLIGCDTSSRTWVVERASRSPGVLHPAGLRDGGLRTRSLLHLRAGRFISLFRVEAVIIGDVHDVLLPAPFGLPIDVTEPIPRIMG